MGLWERMKAWFGPDAGPTMAEAGPLALGEGAKRRLAALPPGQGLLLETPPAPGGWQVLAQEVPGEPDADGLIANEAVRERLRGLELDHSEQGWVVTLRFSLYAKPTPNPEAQQYLASRPLARGRPASFRKGDGGLPPLARRVLGVPGVATALFRDNTVTVQREPGVTWKELDGRVDAALRAHFLMCGEPVVTEAAGERDAGLEDRVRALLAERVLPGVHQDGGDIELVEVVDGVARVRMAGACSSCPSATLTLRHGVETTLREAFPDEVLVVEAV